MHEMCCAAIVCSVAASLEHAFFTKLKAMKSSSGAKTHPRQPFLCSQSIRQRCIPMIMPSCFNCFLSEKEMPTC